MRHALPAVIAALLAVAPAAHASTRDAVTAASIEAAAAYWAGDPHPLACTPHVTYRDLPGGLLGHADPQTCLIQLDTINEESPGQTCALMLHEYGHLLGYGHTNNGSVMDPGEDPHLLAFTRPAVCSTRIRTYAPHKVRVRRRGRAVTVSRSTVKVQVQGRWLRMWLPA